MRRAIVAALAGVIGCGGGGSDAGMMCLGDDSSDNGGCIDAYTPPGLDTPEDVMTWVPFDTAMCGNGTPAGIGVRRTHLSDDLFVYFSGGGACWDYQSCFVDKKSIHVDETYTEATLHMEADGLVFDHTQTANPLSKASIIYIPYCTGDLHAGFNNAQYSDGSTTKSMHHQGAANVEKFLFSLKREFPNVQNMWIGGSSAGGYGASFNFHQFTDTWPTANAQLMQDGSPFVQPLVNFAAWKTNWNIQYPPGCDGCDQNFSKVVDAIAVAHPSSRIALMHYNNDAVIRGYLGYTSLIDASNALVDTQYSHPNTKAFMVAGDSHTMFAGIGTIVGPGNVPLATWLSQWVIGDPAWATVRP